MRGDDDHGHGDQYGGVHDHGHDDQNVGAHDDHAEHQKQYLVIPL